MSEFTGPSEEQLLSRSPVESTNKGFRYLGVEVKNAENPEGPTYLVPKEESFDHIVDTKEALELKQRIALAINNHEILHLTGGSGHGKTEIPKAMAAQLGFEVYEIDGHGFKTPDDIFGRPEQNPDPEGPAYIFRDKPVTSALRYEPGKTKMLIVNEVTSIPPDVLKSLIGAVDAWSHNIVFTLERNDGLPNEQIQTNSDGTVIIFTSNPAIEGVYRGVYPLSAEMARRVSPFQVPEDLEEDDFRFFLNSVIDEAPAVAPGITEASFLESRDVPLSIDALKKIPGFVDAYREYGEFHLKLKKMLKLRELSQFTHGEPIKFVDYVEPPKILEFMGRFCPEDPNMVIPTFQKALRFYYANRFAGEDREFVDGMIDELGGKVSEKEPFDLGKKFAL